MVRQLVWLIAVSAFFLSVGNAPAQMFVDQKNLSSEAAKIMGETCEAMVRERG